MTANLSIYEQLKAAGVPLDNHYSDLYAKVTPESRRIINARDRALCRVGIFTSQIDGELWYDIPFAFDPYWEARSARG